jgi:putative ABC transport system permease protein
VRILKPGHQQGNWLQNYAYKVAISWWMFVIAGIAAIVIALVTVSFHAVKSALANPVKSLRTLI